MSDRKITVGVIGLGYVGLPLACTFAKTYRVIGFDIDSEKVESVNAGKSYIDAVSRDELLHLRQLGSISATLDFSRIRNCQAVCICVPTPLTEDRNPDTSYIERTVDSIAPHVQPGTLVVLESTSYPGTTDELVRPKLPGCLIAYSPERENPGDKHWSTGTIPKIVGADDEESLEAAVALYSRAIETVVPVGSTRVAEAAKLLENIYRCVNIALVNELKVLFDQLGIDIWEVIDAARTKPFGFQAFYPGPGLGGHCIPIDPFYLSWLARRHDTTTRFIELAGEVNSGMPQYVVRRCMEALNEHGKCLKGANVLILGMAYKPDVSDIRESPGITIYRLLSEHGASVRYNDPHVPSIGSGRHYSVNAKSVPMTEEWLLWSDLVLIATDHSAYDWEFIVRHAPLVVDTRNATAGIQCAKVRKA